MAGQGQARLGNRKSYVVNGRAGVGDKTLEASQVTHFGQDGIEDRELVSLPLCQGGCVIHSQEEIAAVDRDTGEFLCAKHAKVECGTCHEIVGPRSQMHVFGQVYCQEHGRRLALVSAAAVGVAVLLVGLALSGSCGPVYL